MSSSSPDPFGMADAMDRDMAALEGERPGDEEPQKRAEVAAKKTGPGGIPMVGWIGIGVFVAFMFIAIIVAVVAKSGGSGSSRAAELRAQAEQLAAAEASQQTSLRAEVMAMHEKIKSLQDSDKQSRDRIEKGIANQDVQAMSQRVSRVEVAVRQLSSDLGAVSKRVADGRPFEAEMFIRDDLKIVSIGNGIARVADKSGNEFNLRRGDKWDGLRISNVRADRWQVTLSDGSVIL